MKHNKDVLKTILFIILTTGGIMASGIITKTDERRVDITQNRVNITDLQ